MLEIVLDDKEYYDEESEEFITKKGGTLQLMHSLVSISKWESFYEIPFLSNEKKTREQVLSYIKMMTLNDVSDEIYSHLKAEDLERINEHINAKASATFFSDDNTKSKTGQARQIVTSELIYYWMIAQNIPFECQYWHLNRLMTLIKVCSKKNNTDKNSKMSRQEIAARNRELNAKRRAELNTTG